MQMNLAELDKKLRETELQENEFMKSMEHLAAALNHTLNNVIERFANFFLSVLQYKSQISNLTIENGETRRKELTLQTKLQKKKAQWERKKLQHEEQIATVRKELDSGQAALQEQVHTMTENLQVIGN